MYLQLHVFGRKIRTEKRRDARPGASPRGPSPNATRASANGWDASSTTCSTSLGWTAGKISLERENFDLPTLVREVVDRLQEFTRHHGASVEVTPSAPLGVGWDRSRIDQVITNLLTNAAKYGDDLGRPIEISIANTGRQATITVFNYGPGISPEDRERVFERFERAISANTTSGLGLGLYISREIVKMHGGSIEVESEKGAWARFRMTLPI